MQVPEITYTPIPKYPSVTRDIALVVNKETAAGQLEDVIKTAGGKWLKEVHVFDVYEGLRRRQRHGLLSAICRLLF